MADHTLQEQLTTYLTDARSIEVHALEQMRRAPSLAGDPDLADVFAAQLNPDTPGTLAMHASSDEHAERVLGGGNAAAEQIAGTWDAAVDAPLQARLA